MRWTQSLWAGALVVSLTLVLPGCDGDEEAGELSGSGACGSRAKRAAMGCWMCEMDVSLGCIEEMGNCSEPLAAYGECTERCNCTNRGHCDADCSDACDAEHVAFLACYKKECPQAACL